MDDGGQLTERPPVIKAPFGLSLAAVPNRKRLVDLCCPRGHLAAVVVAADSLAGFYLVLVESPSGPVPALVVTATETFPSVGWYDSSGEAQVSVISDCAPGPLWCGGCSSRYTFDHHALLRNLQRKGRKKQMTLGVATRSTAPDGLV